MAQGAGDARGGADIEGQGTGNGVREVGTEGLYPAFCSLVSVKRDQKKKVRVQWVELSVGSAIRLVLAARDITKACAFKGIIFRSLRKRR